MAIGGASEAVLAAAFGRKTGFLAGSVRAGDPERRLPLILLLPEDQRPHTSVLEAIKSSIRAHG
jgi:ATP-dependent phosphofructokinase / diphosphate-dependent phosphofructokinase